MKVKIQLKQKDLQFIRHLILLGKVNLSDIPYSVRRNHKEYYALALRYARGFQSSNLYINTLKILCDDILQARKNNQEFYNKQLSKLLFDYLQVNPYKGEERFELFKNDVQEEILSELCNLDEQLSTA